MTELVRRDKAEAGDSLNRQRDAALRLLPVTVALGGNSRRKLLESVRASPAAKAGPGAARGQDFLYDDGGLPE